MNYYSYGFWRAKHTNICSFVIKTEIIKCIKLLWSGVATQENCESKDLTKNGQTFYVKFTIL